MNRRTYYQSIDANYDSNYTDDAVINVIKYIFDFRIEFNQKQQLIRRTVVGNRLTQVACLILRYSLALGYSRDRF